MTHSQADRTDVQDQSKMTNKENSATAVDKSIKERAQQTKPTTTGWGSLPSTSVFRAVNFELFVKPVCKEIICILDYLKNISLY